MKRVLASAALMGLLLPLAAWGAGGNPPQGGDGWTSIQQALDQKQKQVQKDQNNVGYDQTQLSELQNKQALDNSMLNDCANQNPACPEFGGLQQLNQADAAAVTSAQNKLNADSTQLANDKNDLQQLQSVAAGMQQGQLGGSGGEGAKAVAVNLNPALDDLKKLTGPDTAAGPPSGEPAPPAPTSQQVALNDKAPMLLGSAAGPGAGFARGGALRSAASKLKLGDYAGALQDASAAIKEEPGNAHGFLRAAEADNHLKRYADAETMAREAIKRDPKNAEAWKNLAWALLKQGKYKEALEAALTAAKLKPDMAEAWAIAAFAAERLGDNKAKLEYLRKAAALDPAFKAKLELAERGGTVFTDDGSDSLLGEMQGGGREGTARRLIGLLALALVLGAAGVFYFRRRARGEPPPTKVMLRPPTPQARAPELMAPSGQGQVVGKYELGRLLGRGGMGEVFEARDLSLGRAVAIKKMRPDFAELGSQARAAFLKEARTVAQLHHPAVVEIYDALEKGDDLYLVFELVAGQSAQQALDERGRLPLTEAIALLAPVCEALDVAHARGLIHRDLKPANIMLTNDGRVKLMDFGIARAIDHGDATRTVSVMGTPAYMSPESVTGAVSKALDVYALGVCAYQLLTGRLPFSGEDAARKKSSGEFTKASTLAPGVPAAVDDVIAKTLQPAPESRLKSAGELLGLLSRAA